MRRPSFRLVFLCLLPGLAGGQDAAPRDLTSDFDLPEGLAVTLWAEAPQLFNPTAIDVDARGRVWVAEAVNYRKWDGRNPGLEHSAGDRIVILEDTDGDGACDASTVFAQDPDLVAPLGIAVIGSEVFVSCSPNLFVYTDADGDDVPEEREVLLTGFGGFDHDHGLHSLVAGPDGRAYVSVGNAGPHLVTDRDGWRLRSGSIYNGGGPRIADNKPGLRSDDGRIWTGGLVLGFDYDGGGLRPLAHNFRNNYEVALDSFGNLFQTDNDDDGNQGCRTLWCMEGGNHGFFSPDGSRTWQADRRPEQPTARAHWHQDDPGVVPAGSIHGAGGPTGLVVYEGDLMRRWIDGTILDTDAGARVVFAHRPMLLGAGFDLKRSDFLRPKEAHDGTETPRERAWFRPSDVAVGPDGAVYVADWFDPGVGGHWMGDAEGYGRILRVAPARVRPETPALDLETPAGRIAALGSPAVHVRESARRRLERPSPEDAEALAGAVLGNDARLRARALWILTAPSQGERGEEILRVAMADGDPNVRILALRSLALRSLDGAAFVSILREAGLARDRSAAVRREVCLRLRDIPFDVCREELVALAEACDPADRYAVEALGIAAEGKEEELFAELAAEMGEVPAAWDERFAKIAWRLHPRAAVAAWHARAGDPTLSAEARDQAVGALAFTRCREAAEAMLLLADAGPDDVRPMVRWWIEHRRGNDWREYDLPGHSAELAFEEAQVVFQSEVVRAGSVPIDVDVTGADVLWLVADDGGDGNGCDWADWIEPRFVFGGAEAPTAYADPFQPASWLLAEAAWGEVRSNANCVGDALAIGDRLFERGIGTHAASRIALAVPAGALRFQVQAGVDRGGTSQNAGQTTSVRFSVRVGRKDEVEPPLAAQRIAFDSATPIAERERAVLELAAQPSGALVLLRAAEEGALEPALLEAAAPVLHRHADLGVRALASRHFPRPGANGAAYPSIDELVALVTREGDPARGRETFQDRERAQCITCHRYQLGDTTLGEDVGPDLTRIREKYASRELLDAILNPSAGIAFGYDSYLLETTSGALYSGFLLADGPTVVLKDTQGRRHVFAAEEVADKVRQAASTMPEGIALGLAPRELADLVAFLREDPEREPRFGPEEILFDGHSLAGWTHHLADPAARAEDVWSIADGVLVCKGDPVGYLCTQKEYESFHLTLEWRFDPAKGAGNSGVLLRKVGPDVVWPKSIEAQLHSGNAGDIWNIGSFELRTDPERTNGRRTLRMQPASEKPLGEWNRYDILLNGPRLELRVNGVLQNTADWCREIPGRICLQSEGAEIHFREVRLRPILR